jgi:enoyl-CoA hydratase/carnithine racemase
MTFQEILFDVADRVAQVTLNRPAKKNAFNGAMLRDLEAAWRQCDGDDEIRAVVVTGAGDAFSSGADLSAGAETFTEPGADFSAAAIGMPAWQVRKPVIAAMNGHAIGLGLTLQCDIRILAREGKYGIVQVRRGMMGDAYSHWTLPRVVGISRAAEMLLTGRRYTGEEAFELGLGSRVLPAAEVLPAALEMARDVAENAAPLSVAVSKRLLWQSPLLTPEQVERHETALHRHLMAGRDAIEGPAAWLERRAPRWTLRVGKDWPEWPGSEGE